jgi:hypothetical protein
MNAQDLRIGNLGEFLIAGGGRFPNEIRPIKASEFYALSEHPEWGIPIRLTKDLLLKFHSNDEIEVSAIFQNEITIYDRFLLIWKEEHEFWYVVTADHKEYLTKIEFVHEYQNFIFALTGQELELK